MTPGRGAPPSRDSSRSGDRAGTRGRSPDPYEQRRASQRRERAVRDRAARDLGADGVSTDSEWTAPSDEHEDTLRRVAAPTAVGEVLEETVRRRSWAERLQGASALGRWADIVGPDLAGRCEPVRLAGGTLVLRASDQAWATQLTYLQTHLVQRVNDVLGPGTVQRLQITVGGAGTGNRGAPAR